MMIKAKVKTKYVGLPSSDGSFTTFYKLKNRKTIAFKDFTRKDAAIEAYNIQKTLAAYDLAPRVYGKVRKIDYVGYYGNKRRSNWGYVTEIAELIDDGRYNEDPEYYDKVRCETEELTNEIDYVCGFGFYDCHMGNVGYITRKGRKLLVCIDTGAESFNGEYAY
jgi:hypothetical protein